MGILTLFDPFFRIKRFTIALIVFLILLVLLLTIGWKWAGKSKKERDARLIRGAILALAFGPGIAFAEGVTLMPLLLAVIMMFVSPYGFSLATFVILPVVNTIIFLISWGLFTLLLTKDQTLATGGLNPFRRVILWVESLLALIFFGWLWYLVVPNPVTANYYDFINMLSSKFQFNLPGRLDEILYLAVIVIFFALLTFFSVWLYYRLARWVAGKNIVFVIGFLLVSLALGWQLWPHACDTHESFTDIPNRTCTCRGISFHYYPIMVMDASSVDFCVGIESPVLGNP